MSDDWLEIQDALTWLAEHGYRWSKKTLQNRSSGSQAAIRKMRRGAVTFFNRQDLAAFVKADTRMTNPYSAR